MTTAKAWVLAAKKWRKYAKFLSEIEDRADRNIHDLRLQLATVTAERDETKRLWLAERNKLTTLLARCSQYDLDDDLHDLIDAVLGDD